MPKSDGYKNLIPTNRRSKEEVRSNGRKGGQRSGETRRAKRTMRDSLEILLNLSLKEGESANVDKINSLSSLTGKNVTVQDALLIAQLKKALKGDVRAFYAIREIMQSSAGKDEDTANKGSGSESGCIIQIVRENEADS